MSVPDSDENHDLKRAADQVEDIVRQKISQPESINLCLESTSDWMNATTRHVVLKACLTCQLGLSVMTYQPVHASAQMPLLLRRDSSHFSYTCTARHYVHCRRCSGLQVDPELERTVLVSTKLDTKITQFPTAGDVESFLHPSPGQLSARSMLGNAPFFTSVPTGRVGLGDDCIFASYVPISQLMYVYLRTNMQRPCMVVCPCSTTTSLKAVW